MIDSSRQNPRTASLTQSIWGETSEIHFREHVVALEQCTNAVPVKPEQFELEDTASSENGHHADSTRSLPLTVEQCLADDIASIVAVEEGAQSVAAVCLEEHIDGRGLTVRIAAIDAIKQNVQQLLHEVFNYVAVICERSVTDHIAEAQHLCELILPRHRARVLGRLRSSKWQKPKYLSRSHKKPLWQDFANLIHRVQFLYTKKERKPREEVELRLQGLADAYEAFEKVEANSSHELYALNQLIKSSYGFCTSDTARMYARRLHELPHATEQAKSAIKALQQVEKIAAYWRVSMSLVKWSRQYPSLFQNIKLAYIAPYTPITTEVGYESWAKSCHIHAEVQLAVYYDLQHEKAPDIPLNTVSASYLPRCIGTSKYLCYLCFLFLKHRNASIQATFTDPSDRNNFHVTNTHGRLYDQWTIPDLSDFSSATTHMYRRIIREMDQEIQSLTVTIVTDLEQEQIRLGEGRGNGKNRNADGKLVQWRAEPMTSRENLLLIDHDF